MPIRPIRILSGASVFQKPDGDVVKDVQDLCSLTLHDIALAGPKST